MNNPIERKIYLNEEGLEFYNKWGKKLYSLRHGKIKASLNKERSFVDIFSKNLEPTGKSEVFWFNLERIEELINQAGELKSRLKIEKASRKSLLKRLDSQESSIRESHNLKAENNNLKYQLKLASSDKSNEIKIKKLKEEIKNLKAHNNKYKIRNSELEKENKSLVEEIDKLTKPKRRSLKNIFNSFSRKLFGKKSVTKSKTSKSSAEKSKDFPQNAGAIEIVSEQKTDTKIQTMACRSCGKAISIRAMQCQHCFVQVGNLPQKMPQLERLKL